MSALVLLHPFPLASSFWMPQVAAFGAAGFDVIAPDQRGLAIGAADPGKYSLDDVADDVAKLLDQRRLDQVVLCGLSMGGYVALRFLAKHESRLAGLILSDTKATPDTEEGKKKRAGLAAIVREHGAIAAVTATEPTIVGKTTQETRPEIVGFVRGLGESRPTEGIARALEAMADRPDSTDVVARSRVPILALAGEEDAITPFSDAEAIARAAGGRARLKKLARSGHLASLETPVAWNRAVMSFLLDIA